MNTTPSLLPRAIRCCAALLVAAPLAWTGPAAAQGAAPVAPPPTASSALIGEVGGRPVRADQLTGKTPQEQARRLGALFISPAMRTYLMSHQAEWEPTPADIEHFLRVQRERVKCGAVEPSGVPADIEGEFARMITAQMKMQRFIHRRHGGGRILFQQAGTEAYDATRRLLLDLEARGAFRINDPRLRELALGYWLNDPAMGLMPDPGPTAFTPEQSLNPCPKR